MNFVADFYCSSTTVADGFEPPEKFKAARFLSEVLHSAGMVPKRASICCVTEFPVPPKTASGFLPAFLSAALIRASIGQGQRGVVVSTPSTYRLQTRAPSLPEPFQMLGTELTMVPNALLRFVQPGPIKDSTPPICVVFRNVQSVHVS